MATPRRPRARAVSKTDLAAHPLSALRLIRNAQVEVSIPLVPGTLLPGLRVEEGTVVHVHVSAVDGVLDLERARIELSPPLKGPLFTSVGGLRVNSEGRLSLQLRGLPEVKLGPRIPARLGELADRLQAAGGASRVPIRIFGFELGAPRVRTQTVVSTAEQTVKSDAPGSPRLQLARVSLAELELYPGTVNFGSAIHVGISEGSKLHLEGDGKALRLTAHLAFENVNVATPSLRVRRLAGTARLTVVYQRHGAGRARLTAIAEELALGSAASTMRRKSGDSLELAEARVQRGKVRVEQTLSGGDRPLGERREPLKLSVELDACEATVKAIRAALPFGKATAHLEVRHAKYRGRVKVEPGRVALKGEATYEATVQGLQTPKGSLLPGSTRTQVRGEGRVDLDTERSLRLDGERIQVHTELKNGASGRQRRHADAAPGAASGNFELQRLELSRQGWVRIEGAGKLELEPALEQLAEHGEG